MKLASLALIGLIGVAGCGAPEVTQPPAETTPAPKTSESGAIPITYLAPTKIGAYDVQAMYEEELKGGHFNIQVTGGEAAAVRIWVGPEDASGVVIAKTEIEDGFHHGHVEMPDPIPADARLWIDIESPTGELFKGSTPIK